MNRVWINKEKRRYYRVVVQRDLFGDWTLLRSWGSLDSNRGQVRKEIVGSESDGQLKIREIEKRRMYREYADAREANNV